MTIVPHKVLVASYIGDRLCNPGEIVDFDERHAGSNLERLGTKAVQKKRADEFDDRAPPAPTETSDAGDDLAGL